MQACTVTQICILYHCACMAQVRLHLSFLKLLLVRKVKWDMKHVPLPGHVTEIQICHTNAFFNFFFLFTITLLLQSTLTQYYEN